MAHDSSHFTVDIARYASEDSLPDHICVVSEPNPWKIGGRVWDIGWYGIVPIRAKLCPNNFSRKQIPHIFHLLELY